ncbi:MAG TPA: DNA polymerase III subunit gamma/tau [Coriobacteriia bacterium]|nr:MAG: DNA polymerase III, subunit gamma and tau [Actinobacteria bacterium 66_15]HAL30780.1 DNA polymerase III subunit gamma/tau [Coriobacteriia bacterium]
MTHLSWYRKYRPQTFDDVVGQPHIQQTLRNAVADGGVAHAYLFTGPRGTGKTTTARILAKALNCEQGPTADPDDTCDQCRAIADGTHPDVQELDAASRTGVEDVREQIIGRLNYAPARGRWKVYIIDEVHMLSTSAFNALLKSLEEPPERTVFILCTTHPHKVPETIHSRCQRFDFRRLSVEDIVGRLRTISEAEGVDVPDGALTLIAKHALGGMRDAITTLEQLASFGGGTIRLEDVEGLLGEVDADVLFEAASLVLERDVAGAFRFVARMAEAGIDMAEFVKGLVRHFRDLFVLAAVGGDVAVDTTSDDLGRLQSQATRFGADRIGRVLEILERLTTELRYAADQRLAVEVAMTRMARPQGDLTLASLAERVEALEAGAPLTDFSAAPSPVASGPRPAKADPSARSQRPRADGAAASPASGRSGTDPAAEPSSAPAKAAASPGAQSLDVATVKRAWPAVLAEIKKIRAPRAHIFNGTEAEVVSGTLVVEFPADQRFAMDLARETETLGVLRRAVRSVLGQEPPVEYRLGRSGASSSAEEGVAAQAPRQDEAADTPPEPAVDLEASVLAELGGEIIEDVTDGQEDG